MIEIIEKVKQLNLGFDHHDHSVLYNASKDIQNVDGIICEVGLREGGGMGVMILGSMESDLKRKYLAIDPYGNIEYPYSQDIVKVLDYTNQMKYRAMISLYTLGLKFNLDIDLICLEDTEFFKRYEEGVPCYDAYKTIKNSYALVHLDGPHHTNLVLAEAEFFGPRVVVGGYIVVDDVLFYDLQPIQTYLLENGFELVENDNKKASYKKVK
jgi:hypothetical protein